MLRAVSGLCSGIKYALQGIPSSQVPSLPGAVKDSVNSTRSLYAEYNMMCVFLGLINSNYSILLQGTRAIRVDLCDANSYHETDLILPELAANSLGRNTASTRRSCFNSMNRIRVRIDGSETLFMSTQCGATPRL
jgi:hypothetical protein